MSKGIFYTTRAITGREGKNITRHMALLKQQHQVVDFLTGTTSNSSKNAIQSQGLITPNLSLNLYGNWYSSTAKHMANWMEVYDSLDVTELKHYDSLYLVCGIDLHRSNLGRFENRVGIFPNDRGQLKFISAGIHLVNILALLKAHREYEIPLHEIAYDPNEMSLDLFHDSVKPLANYHLYHGYDIPLYNAKRLDSLQYWLKTYDERMSLFEFPTEKTIDFTFGYTVLLKSGRENYPKDISEILSNFNNSRIFVKNEYTKENTHVDNDTYMEFIKNSRFTYMLPSYNSHCFSIYRFLESIHSNCLPLIHPDCNITDVNKSYGIDLSPLVTKIPPMEADRISILHELKSKMLSVTHGFR